MNSELKSLTPASKFRDNILLVEGHFKLCYRDGNDTNWNLFFEKKNLIVDTARKVMAHAMGGDQQWYINQLKIGGDNTLTAEELLSPTLPTIADTDITYDTNVFTRNSTDMVDNTEIPAWGVSYPNQPNETSVLFSVTIGKTEGNILAPDPTVYVSAGLFADSGSYLFASQSFPVITKTPEREILIEWAIRF